METPSSLLDQLRSRTLVDCDTLDAAVAEALGPFEDCTSNQAIAYSELLHTHHAGLIRESTAIARTLSSQYPAIPVKSLAVEICMIKLGLRILPHLNGRIHIQANPFDAYSTARTIASAQRIIEIFQRISPELDARERVCIKIPSTWEGLQACRVLEQQHGITTLATTLFSLEQAALAAEAKCSYVAPYVHELAVHFEAGFIDPFPNQGVCVLTQLYFERHGYSHTKTLPASLVSVQECMSLSGVRHMTIAPNLLQALNSATTIDMQGTNQEPFTSLFEDRNYLMRLAKLVPKAPMNFIDDEEKFRMHFTRRDGGKQEIKQVKAINVFADMQVRLEALVAPHLE